MSMQISGRVGPVLAVDGATQPLRLDRQGGQAVSQLHGRYYEQNYRQSLFRGGMTLTAIANVTFTTGTLGATCTPIFGLYNPMGSGVNAVLVKAALSVIITASTHTGCGGFQWAAGFNERALTLGGVPFNCATLQAAGSRVKNMSGLALTGLVTNLALIGASALNGGSSANFSFVGTAAGAAPAATSLEENLDGSLIVPPGGVLALLACTTPVAHSAGSAGVWEEVPV